MAKCGWCLGSDLYEKYHDLEWGKPSHDDSHLFEMLILEGAQAGLSWITILKKRENYREAFDYFDYKKIATYKQEKIDSLLLNEGIIRNKLKINSAVKNAKVFIQIQKEFGSFDKYLWGFTGGRQIKNSWKTLTQVPVSSKLSDIISKDLKKRGMNFVGSVIIYSYLQAIGVINDHLVSCPSYDKC